MPSFHTICCALTGVLALGAVATRDQDFQRSLQSKTSPRDTLLDQTTDAASDSADTSQFAYLNSRSKKFQVNGTGLPEVPFDIGESYAGLLPISNSTSETRKLFFWFFPSKAAKASDEIVVWLNGGPGCSSLSGLLTENGPFLWQDGTLSPVLNPYSWSKLSNMVWIEQPVGTGFSQGAPNIRNELDLAKQFKGFWKNFVDTFELQNRKVYLTGESYAGMYVPYIANSFLKDTDKKYFDFKGLAINDPVIGDFFLQEELPTVPYLSYFSKTLGLPQSTIAHLQQLDRESGYANYTDKYFRFPPPPQPWDDVPEYSSDVGDASSDAIYSSNPCFNVYHITDTCPQVYAHLGAPNGGYVPKGAEVYFQRADVQKAIHAPPIGDKWRICGNNVFPNGDGSPGPALDGTLANLIQKTQNIFIGSGALDALLPTNGTLFALQNTTWGGQQGFQKFPSTPFYVPNHNVAFNGFRGGYGNLGVWREERGLTFYDIALSGHQLPGYAYSAGYRVLQVLLGRVENFSSHQALF